MEAVKIFFNQLDWKRFSRTSLGTGIPCNLRILGDMKIRELQNREFQGTLDLGLHVS